MEQTSNNLQTYEHPHSISQLSESASAISLPSEPPDIRNWFSSYVYESPDLGSVQSLLASLPKERMRQSNSFVPEDGQRKEEENSADFGNVRETGRAGAHENADSSLSGGSEISEVPDSLQPDTQLSEPPDIRNWFSSYVYESPLLSIDLGEDSSNQIGHDKEGCVDERRNKEQASGDFRDEKHCRDVSIADAEMLCCDDLATSTKSSFANKQHCNQYLPKSGDSSDSSSQLSEPPNLSDWFSSYVYESPELNTAEGFRESFLEQKESQNDEFTTQGCNRDKRKNLSCASAKIDETDLWEKSGSSNCCCKDAKQTRHSPSQEQGELIKKENLSARDIPTFKRVSTGYLESEVAMEHNRSPQVNVEGSWLSKSGAKKNLKTNSIEEPNFITLHVDSVDQAPMSNPGVRSLDKENERADTNSSGFVSVKKRASRSNDENDSRRPWSVLNECSSTKQTASHVTTEDVIKRRPLSEMTNLQDHSDVLGSAGKWKCPQKSKPNLGPPMKQLRLEKWVHLTGRSQ
ncbi:uncharacterized protein LOC116194833 [Punica granatum]|uniref:Uncharacterized protein LOC116194833 n=1 Tax=Punica granatum TaxID=22663 RepID=A0A6P8C7P6_PUNGR|nr:uncharacterized protein LOC116194833 [Punica granatum]